MKRITCLWSLMAGCLAALPASAQTPPQVLEVTPVAPGNSRDYSVHLNAGVFYDFYSGGMWIADGDGEESPYEAVQVAYGLASEGSPAAFSGGFDGWFDSMAAKNQVSDELSPTELNEEFYIAMSLDLSCTEPDGSRLYFMARGSYTYDYGGTYHDFPESPLLVMTEKDLGAPGTPSIFTAVSTEEARVTVTFTASGDDAYDPGGVAVNYLLKWSKTPQNGSITYEEFDGFDLVESFILPETIPGHPVTKTFFLNQVESVNLYLASRDELDRRSPIEWIGVAMAFNDGISHSAGDCSASAGGGVTCLLQLLLLLLPFMTQFRTAAAQDLDPNGGAGFLPFEGGGNYQLTPPEVLAVAEVPGVSDQFLVTFLTGHVTTPQGDKISHQRIWFAYDAEPPGPGQSGNWNAWFDAARLVVESVTPVGPDEEQTAAITLDVDDVDPAGSRFFVGARGEYDTLKSTVKLPVAGTTAIDGGAPGEVGGLQAIFLHSTHLKVQGMFPNDDGADPDGAQGPVTVVVKWIQGKPEGISLKEAFDGSTHTIGTFSGEVDQGFESDFQVDFKGEWVTVLAESEDEFQPGPVAAASVFIAAPDGINHGGGDCGGSAAGGIAGAALLILILTSTTLQGGGVK